MTRVSPNRSSRNQGAFTLVELLVVIGIIALLISILLPSLNRAREAAKSVKCSANLHSIGNAMQLYLQDFKGMLPIGNWSGANKADQIGVPYGDGNDTRRQTNFALLLGAELNGKIGSTTYDIGQLLNKGGNTGSLYWQMFQCPSVPNDSINKSNNISNHYAGHPRLLPSIGSSVADAATGKPRTTVRVSRVKRASDIIIVFDGSLTRDPVNGTWDGAGTSPVAGNLDGQRYREYPTTPMPIYMTDNYSLNSTTMTNNDPIDMRSSSPEPTTEFRNTDTSNNPNNIRFRHTGNAIANALFVDGHVQGFTLNRDKSGTNLLRMNINTSY